jgi:hypothetical protein
MITSWISAIVGVLGLCASIAVLIHRDGRQDQQIAAALGQLTQIAAELPERAHRDGKIDQILEQLVEAKSDHENRLRAGGL